MQWHKLLLKALTFSNPLHGFNIKTVCISIFDDPRGGYASSIPTEYTIFSSVSDVGSELVHPANATHNNAMQITRTENNRLSIFGF